MLREAFTSLVSCPACLSRPAGRHGLCPACLPPLGDTLSHPGLLALGVYDGQLKQLIAALKFRGAARAAPYLGRALAVQVRRRAWPVSAVTSVPSHPARIRERGYDQAELLGRECARQLGRPWLRLLKRSRGTGQQALLPTHLRRAGAAGAFGLHPAAPKVLPAGILLVDDVLTTGASLESCRQVLLGAGALRVWFAAAAAARPRRQRDPEPGGPGGGETPGAR